MIILINSLEEPVFVQGKPYGALASGVGTFIIASVLFVLGTINFTVMLQKESVYLAYIYLMSALTTTWAISCFYSYTRQQVVAFYDDHARVISNNNRDIPYSELYLGAKFGVGFNIYSKEVYDNQVNMVKSKMKVKTLWFIRNDIISKKGCMRYDWLSTKMALRT